MTGLFKQAGYDPAAIARKLGKAQQRTLLSLSLEWGPAADHRAAKRLWYREERLVDHKHRTDNCWCLTQLGMAVRAEVSRLQERGA